MAGQAGIRTFAVRSHMPLLTGQCACKIPADAVRMIALHVKRCMESSQLLYTRTVLLHSELYGSVMGSLPDAWSQLTQVSVPCFTNTVCCGLQPNVIDCCTLWVHHIRHIY